MMDCLPFSQACENNKEPILEVLRRHLPEATDAKPVCVLEIAGGTGQHAVHFAQQLPHLHWQSSDVPGNVDSLNLRIRAAGLPNLPPAIALDVTQPRWPLDAADVIFSANSLHIMPASAVEHFMAGAGKLLRSSGRLFVYGPFKYGGDFTSASNASFDLWLKHQHPSSGIRDFEWLQHLAEVAGLRLLEDSAMPANNQLLIWEKIREA